MPRPFAERVSIHRFPGGIPFPGTGFLPIDILTKTMNPSSEKKLDELYGLIKGMEVAMLTTQAGDGSLVSRPMATQEQSENGDLWFVTNIETDKVSEIQTHPEVSVAYYNPSTREWVSVSGRAVISQDRDKIRELHRPDWEMWFENEGGDRNGGPDDPRLALILVEVHSVHYLISKYSKPRVLFEIGKGMVTGKAPDLGREEELRATDLQRRPNR